MCNNLATWGVRLDNLCLGGNKQNTSPTQKLLCLKFMRISLFTSDRMIANIPLRVHELSLSFILRMITMEHLKAVQLFLNKWLMLGGKKGIMGGSIVLQV